MNRTDLADLISARLQLQAQALRRAWQNSGAIGHCVVDDLLPPELARRIFDAFPHTGEMGLKSSLRERKFVAAQMNRCAPVVEEAVFSFQDPRIVALVGDMTGLRGLEPDAQLYAGGISVMTRGHFLNPHLDNSHDKSRQRYRALNLLYYCAPEWSCGDGGHLELWPDGPEAQPLVIESRFNRLVIMATTRRSWHSVSAVAASARRCCVSNYYFTAQTPETEDYFHVTSFRGRPEQPVRDLVLRADIALRLALRRLFPLGVRPTKHFYDRGP
jgi:Rps23 Pro-64 3,4-dihydroxylase Tpa1-like proline 4-hydroxylase